MYPETKPILAVDIVPTCNLTTLGLADISLYPDGFTAINPTYQITPPMFPSVSLAFDQSSINIYNSNNLNITCTTDVNTLSILPDGIWTVSQSIAPPSSYTNVKTWLRTEVLQNRFGIAFMKTDLRCKANMPEGDMQYMTQIWAYIQQAIAASNQCNLVLAMDMYRLADRALKNYTKDELQAIPTRTSWY